LNPQLITTALLAGFVVWAIYRRVRRNFGRQPFNATRLYVRTAILTVIGALVVMASARNLDLLGAFVAGAAGGVALGYFGLRHTTFETTAAGRFYTPHTYFGLLITGLLLGRLLYRFLIVYQGAQDAVQPSPNPFAAYQKSPLTLGIFGVLIGYYLVFNVGVLRKGREPATAATGVREH
jgi:cytochrome b561